MLAKQITDKEKFDAIVSESIIKVAETVNDERTATRWINAIGRASEMVQEQGEFLSFDESENKLYIHSLNSNEVYTVNGKCECKASALGQPCWHLACKRLFVRYMESVANVADVSEAVLSVANIAPLPSKISDYSDKPYLKNTSNEQVNRLGGVRY